MTQPFEVRQDLPSNSPATGQPGGRRGGSKYDPFVDAILLAAGRDQYGVPIPAPDGRLLDPEALLNPRWVRYPKDFTDRPAAYALAGNISQQVFKSRAARFDGPARDLKLATSVQAATVTTEAGESSVVFHAWLRVNPASTT